MNILEKYPYLDVKCTLRYSVLSKDIIIIFDFLLLTSNTVSQALMVQLILCIADLQLYFLPGLKSFCLLFAPNLSLSFFLILCIHHTPVPLSFTLDLSPYNLLLTFPLIIYS